MPMVMEEIKTPKKAYPETTKVSSNGMVVSVPKDPKVASRLMPLYKYLDLARRMIGNFAPANSRASLLDDEDAVSFVAHEIMKGDWDYDGRTKLTTYRGVRARLGIDEYLGKLAKPPRLDTTSIDAESDGRDLHAVLSDKGPDPLSDIIDDEDREGMRRYYQTMVGMLTEPQRQCVTMYYVDDLNLHEIAIKLGISRQGVHRNIQRAVGIMKEAAGV